MACSDNVSLLLYGSYRERNPAEADHVYVEKKKKNLQQQQQKKAKQLSENVKWLRFMSCEFCIK